MPKRSNGRVVPVFIHPGYVDVRFMASLMQSQAANTMQKGFLSSSSPRTNKARTESIDLFLTTGAEWMWYMDTDMTFGIDVLPRLLKTAKHEDAHIVAALGFIVKQEEALIYPNYFMRNHEKKGERYITTVPWPEEAFEVDAVGSSCMIVHRTVIERLNEWLGVGIGGYPYFDEERHDGVMIGPDLIFSERAKHLGFKIMYEPRAKTGHIKDSVITEEEYQAWTQF